MKNIYRFSAIIILSSFYISANAYLRLPDIFSDNMVLQQQTTIHFYGWGDPTQKIRVVASWNSDTLRTTAFSDAVWSVNLKTPTAGGPYKIIVIADTSISIQNVLIGENWVCSGQSNMEFSADWHFNNYQEEIQNANYPEIRFFHIQKISAPFPQEEVRGKWEICTPQSMHSFSAAGYFFGRTLNQNLDLPIGLIESCWGGSPVEAWTPEDVFKNDQSLATSAAILTPVPWAPVTPSVIYNAMIAPIVNFPVAGVIWYQGESNVTNAAGYEATFSAMINSWRQLWKKDLPFYFVQIAPFTYGEAYGGAQIREAQLQTYRNVPNTGIVVVTDITGDTTDIHPKNKKDVGIRLADWALAKTYGKANIIYSGPLFRSMQIKGNKAIIQFDFAASGLMKKGKELTGFVIAGEDHHFVPAIAYIHDSTVVVYNSKIAHPTAVRMGFTNTAIPNLFNKAGLPASPFRTDEWELK